MVGPVDQQKKQKKEGTLNMLPPKDTMPEVSCFVFATPIVVEEKPDDSGVRTIPTPGRAHDSLTSLPDDAHVLIVTGTWGGVHNA